MERDFLGIGAKESMVKEETRGSCKDSVFLASSGVHRPFPTKMSNLQQFLSFKATQEDRHKNNGFDQFSSSGFQPMSPMGTFDAPQRASSVLMSQKNFGFENQIQHPFPLPMYQSPAFGSSVHPSNVNISSEARMFSVVSSHSVPVTTGNNFFKGHGPVNRPNPAAASLKQQEPFGGRPGFPAPVVESLSPTFSPRNSANSLPATAQLTIFYAGSVNVYDNVPLDKAQAIMFMAANGSNLSSNKGNVRNQEPLLSPVKPVAVESVNMKQTPPPTNVASPCSGLSSPISVTSHSTSGSSTLDDIRAQKSTAPSLPKSQNEPLKTTNLHLAPAGGTTPMTRAVPMARKASLARFLEKRKERVTNVAPYLNSKPTESGGGVTAASLSGKSLEATGEMTLPSSNNREHSWCFGAFKYSTDAKPPNTKLEI